MIQQQIFISFWISTYFLNGKPLSVLQLHLLSDNIFFIWIKLIWTLNHIFKHLTYKDYAYKNNIFRFLYIIILFNNVDDSPFVELNLCFLLMNCAVVMIIFDLFLEICLFVQKNLQTNTMLMGFAQDFLFHKINFCKWYDYFESSNQGIIYLLVQTYHVFIEF